jgi:hypothetical protein
VGIRDKEESFFLPNKKLLLSHDTKKATGAAAQITLFCVAGD